MKVLAAASSVGAVLGPWGSEKTEGSRAGDIGAGGGEVGTEGTGAKGSPICSTGGGSSVGIFADGWSWAGRGTERGISHHRSTVRLAAESLRRSNLGSSGKPICSTT